jgi:hypothetical protein
MRIQSLNYMRGRTFLHKYIILDEAQNLTAEADEDPDHPRRPRAPRSSVSATSRRSTRRT